MEEWHVVFERWYVALKVLVYMWYVVCCIGGVVFTYAMWYKVWNVVYCMGARQRLDEDADYSDLGSAKRHSL